MRRFLPPEHHEEIKKLRNRGWKIKALAEEFAVSQAEISHIINGKTAPRKNVKPPRPEPVPEPEPIFKDLPNNVLFRHVRAAEFIG